MNSELEHQKEKLSGVNHRLKLCMKEQEILDRERQILIQKIQVLEEIDARQTF